MGLFSNKRVDEKLEKLDQNLADSFAKVKQDTNTVFEWLNYFYNITTQQERTINELKLMLENTPKRSEIRVLREEIQSMENSSRMQNLAIKLEAIEQKLAHLATPKPILKKELLMPVSSLKQKIVKKVSRSSKEYIKHTIKSLIAKYGKISALELRDMVVDEQNLCSKSTFYRLLEELEKEEDTTMVLDKKTKMYIQKIAGKQTWK